MCIDGVEDEVMYVHRPLVNQNVLCKVCNRNFSHESDKKRHECVDERRKPVSEQKEQCNVP